MAQRKMTDKTLCDARKKAIEKAHLPEDIKQSFDTEIKQGRVVLNPRKGKVQYPLGDRVKYLAAILQELKTLNKELKDLNSKIMVNA